MGMRVDPMGDVSDYFPGPGSFMAGLWGAATENPQRPEGLLELPHWAGLRVSGADRELRRADRELEKHWQELDMKTATVRTGYIEHNSEGTIEVLRETWLARGDPHIGVISAEIKVTSGAQRVYLDELLDCMHIPEIADNLTRQEGEDLLLELVTTRFGHGLHIRSRILVEGLSANQIQMTMVTGSHGARKRICLSGLNYGQSVKVTKIVALVASTQESDPAVAAARCMARAAGDLGALRARHEAEWAELWNSRIECSDKALQRLANACLFYLNCSLRPDLAEAHGPCGLFGNGWDGLVFWDTELWTLPPMALFHPAWAKSCVAYRHKTLAGARANATANGEVGTRYGWMSGETGKECCRLHPFPEERHIVSCVALGQCLYAYASGDQQWLKQEGLEVICGCAEYWAGRAVYDPADGKYHILQVCGSDEHAGLVDDNATTNWGAALTLHAATRLMRAVGKEPPAQWQTIADNLIILWDNERGIPLQMRQWQDGMVIKQADATMLIHPWDYPMDRATMERTVDYYRPHYEPQPIMMGFAIDGIIDCRLGRTAQVTGTLRELSRYFRLPFLITTESPANERLPFLTGMGGFLQFLLNGIAGLHSTDQNTLTSRWACLPDGVEWIRFHGIHHAGRAHRVTVYRDEVAGVRVDLEGDAAGLGGAVG